MAQTEAQAWDCAQPGIKLRPAAGRRPRPCSFPRSCWGGGVRLWTPTPHPILLLGCQNASGDFGTWGSLLAALGARMGVLVPLPVLGDGANPPPPTPQLLTGGAPYSQHPPLIKGLGLLWPYRGCGAAAGEPCPHPPTHTRHREAPLRAFIGVGRGRSCSGSPRPWPRRRLWGAWMGGERVPP